MLPKATAFPYTDILNREHPVSKRHVPMARLARAAQFAPFAALTGYEEAVALTGKAAADHIARLEQGVAIEGL